MQAEAFGVTPGSRVLQFASASFDAAFWEVCMGLLTGATLVMGSKETLAPGEPLAAYAAEHGVTHATLTPATVAVLPEGAACPPAPPSSSPARPAPRTWSPAGPAAGAWSTPTAPPRPPSAPP